jgi:hypothetical protein
MFKIKRMSGDINKTKEDFIQSCKENNITAIVYNSMVYQEKAQILIDYLTKEIDQIKDDIEDEIA